MIDGKPMYSGLNGAALASTLRAVSESHQTVHQEDRELKALLAMAADAIDALIHQRRDHLNKIQSARLRYIHKERGVDTAEAMYRLLVADESNTANVNVDTPASAGCVPRLDRASEVQLQAVVSEDEIAFWEQLGEEADEYFNSDPFETELRNLSCEEDVLYWNSVIQNLYESRNGPLSLYLQVRQGNIGCWNRDSSPN